MNQRVQVLKTIEEFLYECCLLIVFYPWYLLRIIFLPAETLREYRDRFEAGEGDDLVVSPPIFLMITAAVAALVFPWVDFGNRTLFLQFAKLFSADATLGRIVATLIPVLVQAIISALLVEWRTPGGVTRHSFQLPLFLSVLVASVLLIVMIAVSLLINAANPAEITAAGAIGGIVVLVVGIGWFINAQSRVFELIAGTGRLTGVGLSLLAAGINEVLVTLLLPQG
ncbi:MAG: hypothetical protein JSR96_06170 [Proteobacteria bacterium]|nr:hypothetical protein [Pseudomonadota bacterium]